METELQINRMPFQFKAILIILLSRQNHTIDPFKVAKSRERLFMELICNGLSMLAEGMKGIGMIDRMERSSKHK